MSSVFSRPGLVRLLLAAFPMQKNNPDGRTEGEQREKKKLKFKKMKTLEELLQELGCVGDAFDSTGEFTEAGDKAYRFLLDLLYDIEGLTGESVSSIVKELDGICNENY